MMSLTAATLAGPWMRMVATSSCPARNWARSSGQLVMEAPASSKGSKGVRGFCAGYGGFVRLDDRERVRRA